MTPTGRAASAILLIAFAARLWDVGNVPVPTGDEGFQIPDAYSYVQAGQRYETWAYPPLGLLLLAASMRVFGDDAWGWRMRNVIFGSLAPAVLALLGAALFPTRPRAAWIAGALLAVDPLHIHLSRSTFEEIPAGLFFLVSAWLALRDRDRRSQWSLPLAGVALGASLATKPYYTFAGAALALFVLVEERRRGARRDLVHAAACFVALPAAVFLASYLPWFARGYRLAEWPGHLRETARELLARRFEHAETLAKGGRPAEWFVSPGDFGLMGSAGDSPRHVLFGKNLPAWLLVLPAVAYATWRARVRRDRGDAAVALLFAASYAPLLLATRPVFFYSAVVVLPFGLLAVARALDRAWDGRRAPAAAVVALALLFAAYLYPLATTRAAPPPIYQGSLEHVPTLVAD